MLTASLYTNLVFFILFQYYFSVLSNEVNAAAAATTSDDVFGNASSSASQSDAVDGGGGGVGRLPVFPERTDAVYFLVAVVGGAKMWGRMLAKTLQDLGPPFNNPHGPPLRPIYLDMPQNGRFSSKVLTVFCQQTENRPLAGIIVIGEGQSARAVALAGTAMKLPVLWAKGGTASLNGKHKEIETPFQALLQPSAKEILEAVRAIFLQTHWHSFFVMSDMESSMILKSAEGTSISLTPLVPKILPLPARDGNIFKQLAEISKSTRGVVLLLCNLETARKIMSEAQRLNMVGGHFIWLWADTSSTTEFYDSADSLTRGVRLDVMAVPSSSLQSSAMINGLREKSRVQPSSSSSSQSSSMGRQRENDRRTDSKRGRKQPTGSDRRRGEHDDGDKENSKRGRIHLPVAGRSRPLFESQDDKSRNRRDFVANPSAETLSSSSQSAPSLRNEQLATISSSGDKDDAGGDNEFYEDDQVFDSDDSREVGMTEEDEQEEDEKETVGFAESERRILELLGKAAPPQPTESNNNVDVIGTDASIRLAGKATLLVDDKWDTANLTAPLSPPADRSAAGTLSSSSSDIDPLIKFAEDRQHGHSSENPSKAEEAAKLKRMLNLKNISESDVLFHHFKDFPTGLLALRPVRMDVDRHFIKATVQLFANTWKYIEGTSRIGRTDHQAGTSSGSSSWQYDGERWRRRRRKRRSQDGDKNREISLNTSDTKLELKNEWESGAVNPLEDRRLTNREEGEVESLVNSNLKQQNQSFNASDLGPRENYHRLSEYSSSIGSSSMAGNSSGDSAEEVMNDQGMNSSNFTDDGLLMAIVDSSSPVGVMSPEMGALPVNPIIDGRGDNLDESGLLAMDSGGIQAANDSGGYGKEKQSVKLNAERDNLQFEESVSVSVNDGETMQRNMRIKSKRKSGASEQQEMNQRQQIMGAWIKSGGGNNKNVLNSVGSGGRRYGSPQYAGGCYGTPNRNDARRAETFARLLRRNTQSVLEGQRLMDGPIEKSLITRFELLNLVPQNAKHNIPLKKQPLNRKSDTVPTSGNGNKSGLTKWRRVGLITGNHVHLDTIVWPGGDIVVSGLSARPRSIFRVVTALAPPFVMESELDEDGLCLRGLACHRLLPTGQANLTQIFNSIETRARLEQDALAHGWEVPESEEKSHNPSYKTKCCYGLSMDLLENVATELGFQFHLYLVRDELFGTKYSAMSNGQSSNLESSGGGDGDSSTGNDRDASTDRQSVKSVNNGFEIEEESDWEPSNADASKKYFMNEEKIFGQKNPHVFYNLDAEGKRTQFNRDFGYMKELREKENAVNAQRKKSRNREVVQQTKWNGIIGDLISGSADMSFAALSVSKSRVEVVDFSTPYFHSGVSLLAAPQTKSEIPLLAFLLPFSPELWIAIFTSLNITAVAVAIYEWLSPFGLNPWGRQRNKNFSMSSALWVMWGLLCGHLVAFKAPKSWPNKFLINVWGGFSVIFVASYTANIAALIAGLFFHNAANKYEASLFTQRLGTPRASAAEMYLQKNDRHLWEHMKKFTLHSLDEGVTRLKNGSLDLLMADSPILDYYRATDSGCNLQRIGETYVEDAYAIGMTKGFPLKDSISEVIANYIQNGYLDILTEKWYGGLPCFKLDSVMHVQPRPLELSALAGVYLLLGMGMILGILILIFEHWFYKYTLPLLRHKPNGSVWKSPNIMFFSQKLYRFINCVDLVSPHHAARELVHTLRQGQIASLFQKSIKRKEDEQRRRRKSKAQFFEMIQEIRRINFLSRIQQQHEAPIHEVDPSLELNAILSPDKLSLKVSPKPPKGMRKDSRSRSNSSGLNVRRFSTDSILAYRLDTIGRRLSRDITNSPPDLGHRFESGTKGMLNNRLGNSASAEMLTDPKKFDTGDGQLAIPSGSSTSGRKFKPLYLDVCYDRERERKKSADNIDIMPTLKERLAPPICLIEPNKAELRNKMHAELKSKYASEINPPNPNPQPQIHKQTSVKPPRRGPLPLPPNQGGEMVATRNVGGLEHVKPKLKITRPEMAGSSSGGGAMVVGVTLKGRPTPSPRHVNIATRDSADQTVPVTSLASSSGMSSGRMGRKNGKSKLSREDLLKISRSSSQAEIDGIYMQNSLRQTMSADPP